MVQYLILKASTGTIANSAELFDKPNVGLAAYPLQLGLSLQEFITQEKYELYIEVTLYLNFRTSSADAWQCHGQRWCGLTDWR
jgi:hypothetical protein